METIHYTNENLDDLLKKDLVIMDFYADWCGPCRALAETFDELSSTREEGVILKINVDNNSALAEEYGVMTIPNVYIYKNGEEINHFVGYKTKEEIEELIK